MRHEAPLQVVAETPPEQARPDDLKRQEEALLGNDLATKQEEVVVDGVRILGTYCQVVGRFGPDWLLVSEVEQLRAAKAQQQQALAEAA